MISNRLHSQSHGDVLVGLSSDSGEEPRVWHVTLLKLWAYIYTYIHMLLKLKPMSDSVKAMYRNHGSFHEGDSGFDVFFPNDVIVGPHETKLVDLQIQCEAFLETNNTRNISYYLYPRSSIWKTSFRMANSIGIIDAGYRGNLMVALDHFGETEHTIEAGTRLFQICSPTLDMINMELVEELSNTFRGSGGFGSTNDL